MGGTSPRICRKHTTNFTNRNWWHWLSPDTNYPSGGGGYDIYLVTTAGNNSGNGGPGGNGYPNPDFAAPYDTCINYLEFQVQKLLHLPVQLEPLQYAGGGGISALTDGAAGGGGGAGGSGTGVNYTGGG